MNVEKLRSVTDVFVHKSCPDGVAAAIICESAFQYVGQHIKIHFIQYGTDKMFRLEPRPNQMFIDITPPKERWKEWKPFNPIVLDHHETARSVTEGLDGVYGDSSESGASLAYKHVMETLVPAPNNAFLEFSRLAAIRDTWQKDSPDWREAASQAHALMFYNPYDLLKKVRAGTIDFNAIQEVGRQIYESIEYKSGRIAQGAFYKTIEVNGINLLLGAFNCTEKLISDAANVMVDNGCDVAIGYFTVVEDGAPYISVSLRTNGEISASAISYHNGGGGHQRAAGFRMKDGLYSSLHDILENVAMTIHTLNDRDPIQLSRDKTRFNPSQIREIISSLKSDS